VRGWVQMDPVYVESKLKEKSDPFGTKTYSTWCE
jgi:hypothetical protein